MRPAFLAADESPEFTKLMGRLHAEGIMPEVARKHFGPVGGCFLAEMRRRCPNLADDEMAWRVHFHDWSHGARIDRARDAWANRPEPPSEVSRRMVAFLSGGFRAPVAAREKVEVK
jgi:hypothetical protein